jgi:hypothetical protein
MPGFQNDCKSWADWLVEVVKDHDALDLLDRLGCHAITSFFTNGMRENEIDWVSPGDMFQAAQILSKMVADQDPAVGYLSELYARTRHEVENPSVSLSVDLADIAKMALFVGRLGVTEMTMQVNW